MRRTLYLWSNMDVALFSFGATLLHLALGALNQDDVEAKSMSDFYLFSLFERNP